MKTKLTQSGYDITLKGLNFERFLQYCKQNNVNFHNILRPDHQTLQFFVTVKDYKHMLKLHAFRNYTVTTQKESGTYFFFKHLKAQVGLLSGLFSASLLFSLLSMFTFHIQVLGNENITHAQIVQVLKQKNIAVGKVNNFHNEEIELLLKQQFSDISLVSVMKQGTNIVIQLKEKQKLETTESDIVAPVNLLITSLTVNQGTALKQKGDMVKKGEVIVAAYIKNAKGEKQTCTPIATLVAQAWYVGQTEFVTKETVLIKTGKKAVSSYYQIGKLKFFVTNENHKFSYFQTKKQNTILFPNFFVPIRVHKTIVYECKQKTITHNFESKRTELLAKSKALAYGLIPNNLTVEEEKQIVSQLGNKTIVQTVLRTTLNITYS